MKHVKILIAFPLLFMIVPARGQVQSDPDSSRRANVHRLSNFLSLDHDQESALMSMEVRFDDRMDSLAHIPMASERRSSAMVMIINEHRSKLKQLFNVDQWQKFKEMLDANRVALRKSSSENHIDVKELPVQQ